MMPDPADQSNVDVTDAALALVGRGWRVLPIKPGDKRPPMNSWQHAASSDERVVRNWFAGLYRDHGLGVATGPDSGLWVLDVDVAAGKSGDETLAELERAHGPLPDTVETHTGSGGRHLFFSWPTDGRVPRTTRDRLGAGLDVRGEGGQVLVAPTIHPNGQPYIWTIDRSPDDVELAAAPEWLLALVCDDPYETVTPPAFETVDPDSIAEWFNQRESWSDILTRDGWSPHRPHGGEQYWTRPGKEVREGHSAVLHLPDGPFVIFSTDGSLAKFALPEARAASGDAWSYSKFGYYAANSHGGDRSEAARRLRELRKEMERATPAPPHPGSLTDEPRAPAVVEHWRTGAEFILDEQTQIVALWGEGDDVLWARGEALHIVAPTGVGKTTVAVQLVAGRLGLLPELLGFPIMDDGDKILYLAMDRPKQIARAMSRVFDESHRDVLRERLIIWRGPLPHDLGKRPETLAELCQQVGAGTVFIDSLKDAAVKLGDEEVGGNLNRAVQYCSVAGIEVCGLHHQRKRTSGGEKPKSLDDVYGSTWITAGAGSVVLLWGAAGQPLVELVHLKQPSNEVGPMLVEHDHFAGKTIVYRGFSTLTFLRNRGQQGATATETARAMLEKADINDNDRKKAQRKLDSLVRDGFAERTEPALGGAHGGQKGSEGARYYAVGSPDITAAESQKSCSGSPDTPNGPISPDTSPDTPDKNGKTPGQITGHVTGHQRTAPSPDTTPPSLEGGGGGGEPSPPEEDDEPWRIL